jgi:hypothetical protein
VYFSSCTIYTPLEYYTEDLDSISGVVLASKNFLQQGGTRQPGSKVHILDHPEVPRIVTKEIRVPDPPPPAAFIDPNSLQDYYTTEEESLPENLCSTCLQSDSEDYSTDRSFTRSELGNPINIGLVKGTPTRYCFPKTVTQFQDLPGRYFYATLQYIVDTCSNKHICEWLAVAYTCRLCRFCLLNENFSQFPKGHLHYSIKPFLKPLSTSYQKPTPEARVFLFGYPLNPIDKDNLDPEQFEFYQKTKREILVSNSDFPRFFPHKSEEFIDKRTIF